VGGHDFTVRHGPVSRNAPSVSPTAGRAADLPIERFDGGYRFLVRDMGLLDPVGLADSPLGPPPNLGGEDRYKRLNAECWIWVESW
jgi:hypothetical protein